MSTGLFDILGPKMVGPSSSHTAGACRLGYVVRAILGADPERAVVDLHGSFAMTGEGHGTRRAIVGGLLGFLPDDVRLRQSIELAREAGLEVEFREADLGEDAHPNTARIEVWRGEDDIEVTGSSIGGGRIRVTEIDGFPVNLSGTLPTIVVLADDVPGTVSKITGLIAERGMNLATIRVDRTGRGEKALMTIETDQEIPDDLFRNLHDRSWVHWIRNVHRLNA
jgi:L-serine dehydratase